jgi:hypothetical protein
MQQAHRILIDERITPIRDEPDAAQWRRDIRNIDQRRCSRDHRWRRQRSPIANAVLGSCRRSATACKFEQSHPQTTHAHIITLLRQILHTNNAA